MDQKDLGWNPGRVLFGLSRIGYTPDSAIADITDNSVTYGAKTVNILINKVREDLSDSRKNNIREYLVIDDGKGMDDEGIMSALALGSDMLSYDADTLSKFGLGLKSASFSQGNVLEVISSVGQGFKKYVVNLKEITDKYFCTKKTLSDEDEKLISKYLQCGRGTIIRIADVHSNNHPSLKTTTDKLTSRLGTIYYYFLNDGLSLYLNTEKIEPFDVLFTDEADQFSDLNEHEWDGRNVAWIKKPTTQALEIPGEGTAPIKAIVEVTQLPHPPTFSVDGEGEQKRIREKYKIESGNYGYYVYRNKRLISWAERFDGIIPQDQDFYSFRGRILLDSSADDAFNIDVKKSHIVLSDEAFNTLSDLSDEYKRKSKKAWQNAVAIKKQMMGAEPNGISNEVAIKLDLPDIQAGQHIPTPEEEAEVQRRDELLKEKIKDRIKKEAKVHKAEEEGRGLESVTVTDEEIRSYASGGDAGNKRIFRVPHIEDNLLWEPYFQDVIGWSVRINKAHRFARYIFEDNYTNTDLQVIFEILLLQLAQAEAQVRKNRHYDSDTSEQVIFAFRETFSNLLVGMLRNPDIKLPPL